MFQDFRPVLKILLRFVAVYLGLLLAYQLYLNLQHAGLDGFSQSVGAHCTFLQNAMGYPSQFVVQPKYETGWFFVCGRYISRMVEGCNAVSVMILFLAFIFAFYKGLKTFSFAFAGLLVLHLMNVLRIVGLNWLIINHPKYSHMGHEYFFPAIIYGSVVALWLVWIKFFALKDEGR